MKCKDSRPDERSTNEQYYPPRVAGIERIEGWKYLPYPVRSVFEEAFAAFESGMPLLAAIGMRAIVEATCVEKGLSDKGSRVFLDVMLHKMRENGMITESQLDRLMVLKNQGNDAAHRFPYIEPEKLKAAMIEVMHLLYDQYRPIPIWIHKPALLGIRRRVFGGTADMDRVG